MWLFLPEDELYKQPHQRMLSSLVLKKKQRRRTPHVYQKHFHQLLLQAVNPIFELNNSNKKGSIQPVK